MTDVQDPSLFERGRAALERHAWADAYQALTEADRAGALTGEGLQLLAQAAYWTAHPDETIEALERAFGAFLESGDRATAAMTAFRVAEQHGMRMAMSQAQGWAARAARLAADDPEWPVHAWLEWMAGILAWFENDFERVAEHSRRAHERAVEIGDHDLMGLTLHDQGHALCMMGRIAEGMALLDEAMTAVIGGEVGPDAAGYIYCGMIGTCSSLGDYGRAAEWTASTLRWCERQSVPAFPGICRIHQAELMRLHGSLARAEEQARLACEELTRFDFVSAMGPAHYQIAEVHRQRGDYQAAEESFALANEHGASPHPGLSLLRLAQGEVEAALTGIRQALAMAGLNHCVRMRLLAAQVTIELAAGDLATAGTALEELESLAGDYDTTFVEATVARARGAVLLARGDAAAALPELRRAQRAWQLIEAPYEVGELRLLMVEAHRAMADEDSARMEARAARDGFERLGARPAAEAAGVLLGELSASGAAPERAVRAFMFTDIVSSTDLVGLIGDEAWEALLAWHDRTLRAVFASHRGQVAHHTGDGFFVAFDDPGSALACAVDVQRALAEHRRTQGFAPVVRIGVHAAEATRRGEDYSGAEVHKAARVAALAEGGEILATTATVEGAPSGRFAVSSARTVSLKGFGEPVEVAAVDWRGTGAVSSPRRDPD